MKKILMVFGALVLASVCVMAEEFGSEVIFKSDVRFDRGSIIKIDGTKLTATAAEINALSGSGGNVPGALVTGNVPVAAITNAAGSVGASIGGNVPQAAITNALASAGPKIAGNIPQAAMTNALTTLFASGAQTTNTVVSGPADSITNTIITRTVLGIKVVVSGL